MVNFVICFCFLPQLKVKIIKETQPLTKYIKSKEKTFVHINIRQNKLRK